MLSVQAGRPASAGADQVRAGNQPQDREGAGLRAAGVGADARRRGDRVSFLNLLRLLWSGVGTKGACSHVPVTAAYEGNADEGY
jgi:hypothetical protein